MIALFITVSCDDTETTDSTSFVLYYTDMTDIGPSMIGIISSPSYKGAQPTDFVITNVKLNDEVYTGNCFSIDPATGAITIASTKDVPVGLYKLSISCMSNAKLYAYNDIVTINMMKGVPDGIIVEPNLLQVEYADVIDPSGANALPTAQVSTDGNHISISKYEIAKSDFSKFFAVSSTGEISIVRGSHDLIPGIYSLSLKLTTGATTDEEGIFENALTVNVTSKPLALSYNPASGKIEEENELSGNTSFTSNAPSLKSSLEGLAYAIKSITPATNKIKIDANTGVLSVAPNHGLLAGTTYKVDVTVFNDFAKEGVDFPGVFELEVVDYIEPISNFVYADVEEVQAVDFEAVLDAAFKGDEVKFELIDLPAALQGQVTIGVDGTVSAKKGNSIPLGSYTIKVKAINPKSDLSNPATTTFKLTIKENENYFTYVHYGNNLGLTPVADYANQFRIATGASISGLLPQTDAKVPLSFEISKIHQTGNVKIDETTGELSNTAGNSTLCALVMVTATAGKGTKAEVSVKTPVFFHYNAAMKDNKSADMFEVLYSPFVVKINPKTGGQSTAPVINGTANPSAIGMDYRRAFNYFSFTDVHISGQPTTANSFVRGLWENYAESVGISPNYGAKRPMSYYDNLSALTSALAYVHPNQTVIVNPNKWVYNGEYANGCLIGQITVSSSTVPNDISGGAQMFPIVLWFDTNF